jgi:hypothetical protein
MSIRKYLPLFVCGLLVSAAPAVDAQSTARLWNESCLDAIRLDFPAPTVHARNLFHLSAAMYDAWAAYEPTAVGVFHNESASAPDLEAARREAISYAAYRILSHRYALSVNAGTTLAALDARMTQLGYPDDATGLTGPEPAAVGNRCAVAVLAAAADDQSDESHFYAGDSDYEPVNDPLVIALPGTGPLADPNRWQPLAFDVAMTQNGLITDKVQRFVGAHWGRVTPFALAGPHQSGLYPSIDPGPPPLLGGADHDAFLANAVEVIRFSSKLDPLSSELINLSPSVRGNNPLGENTGEGHAVNPITGEPYPDYQVAHADFGRVIAEYWADGPESETPPGHWNAIANELHDHPDFQRRLLGEGPPVDPLEWDVKLYLTLNAALHDTAVAAWGVKVHYDYVRPITCIRHCGSLGQSSDPTRVFYHPDGLPEIPDLIELVTPYTSQAGGRHEGLAVGEMAIRAWRGEPADPETETGGVGWISSQDWLPYQRSTFVTPAFAGYVSGHSAFSRAAAEVLAGFTGSPFFPGGIKFVTIPAGSLEFEAGPDAPVRLQWATYYDAADEAGISRLYGGIHVAADDGPGRVVGARCGTGALDKALAYIDGGVLEGFACRLRMDAGARQLSWDCLPGYLYKVQVSDSPDPESFVDLTEFAAYPDATAGYRDETVRTSPTFYRVIRQAP